MGNSEDPAVFNIAQIEALPVTGEEITSATLTDPTLHKVLQYTRKGWPSNTPQHLQPYHSRRDELSVEGDCLLWGTRVVVPQQLRATVLDELHQGHPGVVRMKAVGRSHAWWPCIDRDIEQKAKSCVDCQSNRHAPPKAPLHPWAWPTQPWQRVHIDYAGPVAGRMLLVAVDAHSKWPEVLVMKSSTSAHTIVALRDMFARWGLPEQLVTVNGTQFTSEEFQAFLRSNGIKHIRTAPYHPATNGSAERLVQTVKQALKAGMHRGAVLEQCLASFLLQYRNTPHATTGVAPSLLPCGRKLRTRLELLRSSTISSHVQQQQGRQKQGHDKSATHRMFEVGQRV